MTTTRQKLLLFIRDRAALKAGLCLISIALLVLTIDKAIGLSSSPLKILANTLPAALTWLTLLAITRRFNVSLIICLAGIMSLFAVNYAKHEHIGQHLVFQDIFLVPLLVQGWDVFAHYTNIWAVLLGIAMFIAALILAWREPPLHIVASALLLATSLTGFYAIGSKTPITESLFGPRAFGAKPWEADSPSKTQGLLVSLVSGVRSANLAPPEYDNEIISKFIEANHDARTPSSDTLSPDIILWLGESYFDPGILADIDTCDYLPAYCGLANSGLTSAIKVPTYGGNTTRTEFEVLTGIPFKLLGSEDYPYVTTVHSPFDSIVWSLKASSYHTVAIHPHDKTFWQRHRAFPLLGFDEYLGEEDLIKRARDGLWISDDTLADAIIHQLTLSQTPSLIFAISMEGHGPFGNQKNLVRQEALSSIQTPAGVAGKAADAWRDYIYHAQNTMRALTRLKEHMDQRKRPTILVFFGDHLPGLNTLFDQISFDDGKSRYHQKTPVLALANYPISIEWLPQSSHELGLWSLELAGSKMSPHFQQFSLATSLSHKNQNSHLDSVIKAMQLRQLNLPPQLTTENVK